MTVEVDRFSTLNVSRATHLPAIRGAAGLLYPAPWPSLQLQSLPKRSLSGFYWKSTLGIQVPTEKHV